MQDVDAGLLPVTVSEDDRVDFAVIGAGVLGAAVASNLARKGFSVMLLEGGPRAGEGVTSRNSGVVHAGLYYPPKSLKAECCIRGSVLLYEWVERHEVPFRKSGKLVVATHPSQLEELESIFENARACGARGLELLTRDQARSHEPGLSLEGAILSRETGIVDPSEFTRSLVLDAEAHGANLVLNTEVQAIEGRDRKSGYSLQTTRGPIRADAVVNCAGLHADEIAAKAGITKYRIYPCRGDYFQFQTPVRYERLIYPVKEKNSPGLGIHLTIDLQGRYKLGPDTEYVDSKTDFRPAEEKHARFKAAAEKLFGPLKSDQIRYDSCGIRPKLRPPHEKAERDFVLSEDLPGFFNFVGIESPGLTAALALAEKLASMIG